MSTIDINCDMGESFGPYRLGADPEIMPLISSANIACGFHAGDPQVMRETVSLAARHGVAVGAHPGFPDLQGFGRRNMALSPEEVEALIIYQIGALGAFAQAQGLRLQHVKPHGALYNMAARDPTLAEAIARAVRAVDPRLILFVLPGSEMEAAAKRLGVPFACELFADRNYQPDGTLTPRSDPRALIRDAREAAARAVQMVKEKKIRAVDDSLIPAEGQTLCVHGDTPGATEFARHIRRRFQEEGIQVLPVARILGLSG